MFKIETIRVKGSAFKAAQDLVKAQGKYRRIGSGAYGTVYGMKTSDVVYKIGDMNDNEGYLAYIEELAKLKKHNPYTPRIYGVRIYKGNPGNWGEDNDYFVVAMEKLSASGRKTANVRSWFCNELEDSYSNGQAPAELGIKFPKVLAEALAVLRRAYKSCHSASWDLHSGNFMVRGKQLVVTDPLA